MALLFVLSRIIFYAAGVRYDASFFTWAPQSIDIDLLKTRLWESIWYMHGQPPLFNLYNGLVMQFFPTDYAGVFHLTHLVLGLVHVLVFYSLFRLAGVIKNIAIALTVFFIIAPFSIIYENWHYYSYFEMVALTSITGLFAKYVYSERIKWLYLMFFVIGTLILTRSTFHLAWFFAIAIILIAVFKISWKKVLKASLIPLLLIVLWYGKNYYLYNKFTASTWLGMSMARVTGANTNIAQNRPLTYVSVYNNYITRRDDFPDVPLLHRNSNVYGSPNLNHIDYIEASDLFLKESVKKIKNDPLQYLENVAKAHLQFFEPVTLYWFLLENLNEIAYYSVFIDFRIINISALHILGHAFYHQGLPSYLMHAILFIFTCFILIQHFRSKPVLKPKPFFILLYMLFNMAYYITVCNWVEYGENNRFRFTIIPLTMVLTGIMLTFLFQKYKAYQEQRKNA